MLNRGVRNNLVYNRQHPDFPRTNEQLEAYVPKWLVYLLLWSFADDAKLKEFRCDYRADCLENSDEAGCDKYRWTTMPPPTPAPDECLAPSLRCDNGSHCVPLLQLCDGSYDCADGADEADRCGEPMCVAAPCTHECHPTPSGAVCACPPTLHLQRDGVSCDERHVCMEWGVCSQTCKPQKNRHKCTCYEGYKLADDGFTCKSTDSGYSDHFEDDL